MRLLLLLCLFFAIPRARAQSDLLLVDPNYGSTPADQITPEDTKNAHIDNSVNLIGDDERRCDQEADKFKHECAIVSGNTQKVLNADYSRINSDQVVANKMDAAVRDCKASCPKTQAPFDAFLKTCVRIKDKDAHAKEVYDQAMDASKRNFDRCENKNYIARALQREAADQALGKDRPTGPSTDATYFDYSDKAHGDSRCRTSDSSDEIVCTTLTSQTTYVKNRNSMNDGTYIPALQPGPTTSSVNSLDQSFGINDCPGCTPTLNGGGTSGGGTTNGGGTSGSGTANGGSHVEDTPTVGGTNNGGSSNGGSNDGGSKQSVADSASRAPSNGGGTGGGTSGGGTGGGATSGGTSGMSSMGLNPFSSTPMAMQTNNIPSDATTSSNIDSSAKSSSSGEVTSNQGGGGSSMNGGGGGGGRSMASNSASNNSNYYAPIGNGSSGLGTASVGSGSQPSTSSHSGSSAGSVSVSSAPLLGGEKFYKSPAMKIGPRVGQNVSGLKTALKNPKNKSRLKECKGNVQCLLAVAGMSDQKFRNFRTKLGDRSIASYFSARGKGASMPSDIGSGMHDVIAQLNSLMYKHFTTDDDGDLTPVDGDGN